MLIIFVDIKGIVRKEFVMAGKQSIPHAILTFYGDCVKLLENFAPNFSDKRTDCRITITSHFFINQGFFFTKKKKTIWLSSLTYLTFLCFLD
jgi:hypothetical protein